MRRLVLLSIFMLLAGTAPAAVPPRMETRWPGVHLVWYDDLNMKSVVAEFASFLAVVEVPHDDATARSLLGFLRERFPDKPLRFAFHTHHHGHSLGSIDPLLTAGVTLATTPWNLEQVRKLAADPKGLDGRVLSIRDGFELADASNRLRVHVLSKAQYEVPADEYVVVEFPGAQALVSGCLFNKPLGYWEVVNTRKTSLSAFLVDSKLSVDWLLPTNSAKGSGFEDVCRRELLAETLEKGIKPDELADRLQRRSVADLRNEMDKLVAEFRTRTPRSYDLLVCGNYLKSKRKDPERAAVLFEVAARLFPKEVEPAWNLGVTWAEAGDKAKARSAFSQALALATKDEDKAEIQAALDKL
jgi:hypothetical protein